MTKDELIETAARIASTTVEQSWPDSRDEIVALVEAAVAEATGPERDLADLEMMAKKFDYHPVRQGVYVYWDDGQYVYRQSPMGNHITRADALALLREKGAK